MAFGKVLGIITEVEQVETGQKKNGGTWSRQTFVLKKIEESSFEHFVALTIMGDAIQKIAPQVGQTGFFVYDVESNKSKEGRWFTTAVCKRFEAITATTAQNAAETAQAPQAAQYPVQQMNAPQSAPYAPQAGGFAPQYPQGGAYYGNDKLPFE